MKHKNSGEKPPEFYVLVFLFLLLPSLNREELGVGLYLITTFLPLMMYIPFLLGTVTLRPFMS